MSYNSVVKSKDPRAIELLKENVGHLKERLQFMQSVNDYYKEHGTMDGFPDIDPEMMKNLNERVTDGQKTPYPGKFFTDNKDAVKRLEANIERLTNNPETIFKGWEFNGGEAIVNLANNRLQLAFEERPSDEQLNTLKKNGFKWGSRSKCWQRQLTHKSFEACDKINFIKPKDGINPSDLQPKTPKRNEPER